MSNDHDHSHLSPCNCCMSRASCGLNRREFMGTTSASLAGLGLAAGVLASTSDLLASKAIGDTELKPTDPKPLRVQPVLAVTLPKPKKQASWRGWGAFHTQKDIDQEQQRIKKELNKLAADSEFPLEILPLVTLNDATTAAKVSKGDHDVMLIYAANTGLGVLEKLTVPSKWTIMFVRHKSGPVYLWYEIAHNRYLRKMVDEYGQQGMGHQDVIVDSMDQMQWRLRALYGLKNTMGKKVVCVGGPAGWGTGGRTAPEKAKNIFNMDLQTVTYEQLAEMIKKAKQNKTLVKRCNHEAGQYLKQQGISLDTDKQFVEKAFLLNEVFKTLISQAQTDAFTICGCMATVMPISETTACLPLTLMNDSGYNAYCESDFVVIPSGVMLHYISGKPVFLNDPTYPHDNVVTLAHCTAPRKMDGKNYEPAKILTHYESDYGAAPKVDMKLGQEVTVINPDFSFKRWLGFEGEIIDNPFLDICRSQSDVQIKGDCDKLVAETKGFHWMLCYGNYLKEIGYALKKVNIDWMNLS